MKHALQEANLDEQLTADLLVKFHPRGPYSDLFPQLATHHLQLKYCREHLSMLVSFCVGTTL